MRSNFFSKFLVAFGLLAVSATLSNGSNIISTQVQPGTIFMHGAATCPTGSLAANGGSYLRSAYPALYASIGANWGSVDGTHFSVPDLRGVFPRGTTAGMGGIAISAISSNNATVTAHGFQHSGVPVRITGSPPTGLSTSTTYYVIYIDANTIAFATSVSNALATTKIAISGTTGGTVAQWADPDAGSRFANSIGAASTGVGSSQLDEIISHSHTITGYQSTIDGGNPFLAAGVNSIAPRSTSQPNGLTGGNETRAKNVYVLYCIKF